MAFDQNSIPKDLRPINIPNPPLTDLTVPPSVPVYFVPAAFDSNVPSWGTRLPATPTQPVITPPGFVQNNPILGLRAGSNATDQASDHGGDDSVSGKKVKLLCSFGGKILPRPTDGMLRYVGGQTRIISVRRDVSYADLVQKMADVYGQPVSIKYQLPDEDLDALVSISCSDDLENMMDEYEKLLERSSDGSAKMRVFLFSASELDSSGMVQFGDLQDGSQKYVEALNGVMEVGITRKGSMASLSSTQNSDLSGADGIDASPLGQDLGNDAAATNESSLRPGFGDSSPTTPQENSGFPLMLERTMPPHPQPVAVAHQPALGFDLQQLASNFPPPPPPPYLQSFIDPQQDSSNSTSQVFYRNHPQMVATTGPVLLQPQFHDTVPAIAPQQFIPASQMTIAPPSSHLSTINPGMMPRLVPIPADQGYNAYHAQVPPPGRVAGYGWPQAPTTHQQLILPEQLQKIDDCTMCQKQLPHAHSDGIVQEQRDSSGTTVADVNSMYRSLRLEDAARFQPVNNVVVPSQADVAAVSRNLEVPQNVMGLKGEIQSSNVGLSCQDDGVQHFIPPMSHELGIESAGFAVSHERVNLIDGMQVHHMISPPEILSVDQPIKDGIFTQQSQQMVGREQFPNDAFSQPVLFNEANAVQPMVCPSDLETVLANSNVVSPMAASNWSGNVQESSNSLFINQDPWNFRQEPHYPPPRPSKLATRKEASAPRDFFHESQLGYEIEPSAQAHILDPANNPLKYSIKDQNSEQSESNQGSSDDLIKQELQATAEGVAASVLKSSLASSADTSFDANQERELLNNSDAVIKAKLEGMKVKPETANLGFPLSDGLGSLQIIKNSDLEELRELGSGTFGTVYHGKWRGTDVAIKRINERCFAGKQSEQERMREDFWNEAIRLAELHHPNVVAFYGVVLDGPGGSIATVTEYMVNGSLRSALQKNERSIDKRKLLVIAMDAAFGMEYLHSKNIVHFDLKSDNLLVNLRDPHRPICKVGDLGLSKVKCKTLISGGVRGTLPWMAPELLNGSSSLVSEKVDVFSFGIVMWELLTGEEPYSDLYYGAIIGGIVSNTLRPSVPANCDPDWRLLMEKCWSAEPKERPNFTKIANELRLMLAKIPPKGQAPTTNTRIQQVQGV